MKRVSLVLSLLALLLFASCAPGALVELKPNAEELKRMSVFLSNFTEVGFFEIQDVSWLTPEDLVYFGIRHNYINNFKSRIRPCKVKNCPYGSMTIEAKWVAESVKKYFDIDFKDHGDAGEPIPIHYDGKLYHFDRADGEKVYYAQVQTVARDGNVFHFKGHLYNIKDKKDIPALFRATAKAHTFGGKKTWALLSMETLWN